MQTVWQPDFGLNKNLVVTFGDCEVVLSAVGGVTPNSDGLHFEHGLTLELPANAN
jgi:hypothetical protein